jgi:protease-4
VSPAIAAAPAPSANLFLDGVESVAQPDGPVSLLFNPAAAGVRYPSEFALSMLDARVGKDAYRGAFGKSGLVLSLSGAEDRPLTFGAGLAGGSDAMRFGAATHWLAQRGGGRVAEHRIGVLSRPTPWLSLGAVAEHLGRPRLSGARLEREYTLGLAVRPFALSRPVAHTWGTRLTLTGDALLREDERAADAHYRVGAELEALPGVALHGIYFPDDKDFQLGISLLGVHAGYHGQSGYDRARAPRYATHSLSFHDAEDRTILAGRSDRRVAVVRVGGALADDALSGFSLFGSISTTAVAPIHRQLERALEDPLTRGVLLDLRYVSNMAQLEELRPRIARLKKAGKPVVAYMEGGGGRGDLYLASACDRIVTSPEADFAGLGLRAERRYYRKLLAEWGIRIDRTSYGKYKSAYRNFSVDSTSAPDREVIEHTLDQVQELFVGAVSEDRRIARERLMTVLDGRRWPPRELQKAGVIDSIGYREDALRILGRLSGLGARPRTARLSRHPEARREWTVPAPVAVIFASGGIESGTSGNDLLLGPYMGSETITRQIESAFQRREIKAVVLRVESPGGSSIASDLIHHATERMKRETKKPLVVSMASAAASGGYHISLAADRIFSDRFTRTGSIGVLFVKPSLEGWYAKHRVRQDEFERGRYMRGWSQGRDWDAEIQASADSANYHEYLGFVAAVAAGRKLSTERVDEVAQGRVWLGEDALARQLVDEIGGLEEAVAHARRLAKIPVGEKIRLAEYRRPIPGLIQRLIGSMVSETWERNMRLPAPDEALYWMDDEEAW